ncbi:MAG TPA: Zn-dependent hydrolase, partial [Prolixibacteraceae bacterium]|nr:Zn-dependent hydrolase [Prolixibacteraceae bacterium]
MKKTAVILLALFMGGCGEKRNTLINEPEVDMNKITQMAGEYASFRLETSLEGLSDREKAMLPLLFEAAAQMDAIFWKEAWGDRAELMRGVTHPDLIKMLNINYGPWERLGDNLPIVPGVGAKPAGAAFYPAAMTREEFEAWEDPLKSSLYTLVRRTEEGGLKAVPYHEAFGEEINRAAILLRKAGELAEDPGLKRYLEARAEALLSDDYFQSDMAWMEMKDN